MATVNLGAIRFNWKGAYNNGTAYVVDDVVSSAGNSYICILASTGNAVSNATYWSIMSSAGTDGTDGTDVGTTITTQGDVLYRDGSGLQRLAKGTASQLLTMNAGATAPEWTTPSAAGFTQGTEQATTSGTNFTFGSIPAGTTVIHVNFVGVSTNGSQELQLRIGDAGGIETSGYVSGSVRLTSSSQDIDSDGGAFKVASSNSTGDAYQGTMILTLENAATYTWCSMGVLNHSGSATGINAGSKSLSAELTQVYLWAAGNTFDAGAINISYQ